MKVSALTTVLLLLLGSAVQPIACFGHGSYEGHQRIYFQTWVVGEACGSNAVPGCRDDAIEYLSNAKSMAYQPNEFQIMAAFGLVDDESGGAVDLTKYNYFVGKNFTQFGGVCGSSKSKSTVSLTFGYGYTVLSSTTGCLTSASSSSPKPFAVALVKPPPANGKIGGQVKRCPNGFCLVALNAPEDAAITAGSDEVAKVCGIARQVCTVTVGDFNVSPTQSVDDRWAQLIGKGPAGAKPPLYKAGVEHAQTITNMEAGGAMTVGQGFPLKQYANVTGMRPAELIDLLLPCEHPAQSSSDGCTV